MPQQSERHQPKQKEQQLHVEKHAPAQPTKRELELRQEVESQRKQIQEQQKQIRQQEWQILLLQQQQAEQMKVFWKVSGAPAHLPFML